MLKQAVEWDYLKQNPALAVKPPKMKRTEMDFLTPDEIRTFLNATPDEWKPFFHTAIFTGMRLGELLALQWGDIDWNQETVYVRRSVWQGVFQEPKSSASYRKIGMAPSLLKVLKQHQLNSTKNDFDLVFSTKNGHVIDAHNFRKRVFLQILKESGLRKIRIHDLRHTYASLLINQGENLKFVQSQLGHASITTTVDRYAHLMPDANKNAATKLDAVVFDK